MKREIFEVVFDLKNLIKKIIFFCEKNNIEKSLSSFLSYKSIESQKLPDNINFIMSGNYPKEIVCCSKTFMDIYNSLPQDFKQDLNYICNPYYHHKATLINKKLKNIAIKFLKMDYIYYNELL